MDKMILGMLMLSRLTLYEMKAIIKRNFWAICSDSTGSIQAALKKLLAAGMIDFVEYVEKSVNKKRYSITQAGRAAFMAWLQTPIDLDASNMEFGKLLFMGIVPAGQRVALIDAVIVKAEQEYAAHVELQTQVNEISMDTAYAETTAYWENDTEYRDGIRAATQNDDDIINIDGIAYFQEAALQYGIDHMKFDIEWFKKLKKDIESGGI